MIHNLMTETNQKHSIKSQNTIKILWAAATGHVLSLVELPKIGT